jgi:hypothetical protein
MEEQRQVQKKISRNSKAIMNFDVSLFNSMDEGNLNNLSDIDLLDETDH